MGPFWKLQSSLITTSLVSVRSRSAWLLIVLALLRSCWLVGFSNEDTMFFEPCLTNLRPLAHVAGEQHASFGEVQ